MGARIAAGLRSRRCSSRWKAISAPGKTTLARAILRALGVTEDVPSPTFTLVQPYETPHLTVRHFDLYRIENAAEIDELGLDEALDEGAALIEWPERAGWSPAGDALHVALSTTRRSSRARMLSGPARWAAHFERSTHVG